MKTKTIIVALFGVAMTTDVVSAAPTTCSIVTCSQSAITEYNDHVPRPTASASEPLCVKAGSISMEMLYPKDTTCKSGYIKVYGDDISDTSIKHDISLFCTNVDEIFAQVVSCEVACNNPSSYECEDQEWDITGGHVKMITNFYRSGATTCTCDRKFTTTCKDRYYGDATNATAQSSCKACPSILGADDWGHTSPGASDITGCYVPADLSVRDETGIYKFTQKCYYTE